MIDFNETWYDPIINFVKGAGPIIVAIIAVLEIASLLLTGGWL